MSVGVRRIGRYELHERLGQSKIAEVWKAFDPQKRCYVTLKLLMMDTDGDPNFAVRFLREAEMVASLHHPNISSLKDAQVHPYKTNGMVLAYLVTNYVGDLTLAGYMRNLPQARKFPPGSEIVALFSYLGSALDYAHQHGVVHGGLKPGNVILKRFADQEQRLEPIITDIALERSLWGTTGTLPRRSLESMFYISPEQGRGEIANEYSDLYSLGVMLYEMCTGVVPFQGSRPISLLMQHASAIPPSPDLINPNIPPALTQVIMRSLEKDQELRFASASTFSVALARALKTTVPERLSYLTHSVADNGLDERLRNRTHPEPPASTANLREPKSRPTLRPTRVESVQVPVDKASTASEQRPIVTPHPPSRSRSGQRKQRIAFGVLGVLLLLALVITGLGSMSLFNKQALSSQVVGHAFFASSGQINENINSQGINDELQIDLSNIPDPSSGKSYYAWLLPDKVQTEAPSVFLGKLSVKNGNIHFLYQGADNHVNLLSIVSRFLITEEDANVAPTVPSPDIAAWRYYAELPQAASPADRDHFSMLEHFRHLLVESPELQARGLRGGLDLWLLQSTQKIAALSNGARDTWHAQDMARVRQQLIQIIDYLDGKEVASSELPPNTPFLADARNSQIALAGRNPLKTDTIRGYVNSATVPGYVYLIAVHLSGALVAPDTTPDQRKLAGQVNAALNNVDHWLDQIRDDVLKLVKMTDTQLAQSATLATLNDIVTFSQYAYAGRIDQATGQSQGGVIWVYGNIQRLADFAVKPYSAP